MKKNLNVPRHHFIHATLHLYTSVHLSVNTVTLSSVRRIPGDPSQESSLSNALKDNSSVTCSFPALTKSKYSSQLGKELFLINRFDLLAEIFHRSLSFLRVSLSSDKVCAEERNLNYK